MEKVLQRLLNFRLGNGHVCEPFSSAVAGPRGVYSPSDEIPGRKCHRKSIVVFGIVTPQGWSDLHTTQACRYHLMCKMCTSASIPAALHSLIAKMSCLATIQV